MSPLLALWLSGLCVSVCAPLSLCVSHKFCILQTVDTSNCVCDEGYYQIPGTPTNASTQCHLCPGSGVHCQNGQLINAVNNYVFLDPRNPYSSVVVYPCPPGLCLFAFVWRERERGVCVCACVCPSVCSRVCVRLLQRQPHVCSQPQALFKQHFVWSV